MTTMRTKHRLRCLAWVLVACFGAAPDASAFYNPNSGRWLNRDPLQEEGGLNLYAYVDNEPVNAFDSDGLRKIRVVDKETGRIREFDDTDGTLDPKEIAEIYAKYWAEISAMMVAGEAAAAKLGGKCKNVRCKVAIHGAHHPFPFIGKRCHIQVTCWIKGASGSGVNLRIPIPCPKGKK